MRLVAPDPALAATWMRWREDPDARRFNPLDPLDLDGVRARLAAARDAHARPDPEHVRWFVVDRGGALVASVALHTINRRMRTAEVGYQVAPERQRQGLGTAAVRLLVDHTFAHTDLRRLHALVAVDNVASRRLLRRLGFTEEGTLRAHFLIEGRAVDEVVYGLLREEWTTR